MQTSERRSRPEVVVGFFFFSEKLPRKSPSQKRCSLCCVVRDRRQRSEKSLQRFNWRRSAALFKEALPPLSATFHRSSQKFIHCYKDPRCVKRGTRRPTWRVAPSLPARPVYSATFPCVFVQLALESLAVEVGQRQGLRPQTHLRCLRRRQPRLPRLCKRRRRKRKRRRGLEDVRRPRGFLGENVEQRLSGEDAAKAAAPSHGRSCDAEGLESRSEFPESQPRTKRCEAGEALRADRLDAVSSRGRGARKPFPRLPARL